MQQSLNFPIAESLTDEQKHPIVEPKNPVNPFHGIIGQETVVAKLCRLDYQAIGRPVHFAGDVATGLLVDGSLSDARDRTVRRGWSDLGSI